MMIFWPFRVNAAIAGLGLPPTTFDGQLRSQIQVLGRRAGLTPQETALVLISLAFGIRAPVEELELAMGVWHRQGKVDYEKPEVIDALSNMGYSVDPYWESDAIDIFRGIHDEEYVGEIEEYARTSIAQLFAQARWERIRSVVEVDEVSTRCRTTK